ncbi:MAG: carboxymuconolactone decarboxylase family protein [Dehalococcoidia bacterium]
MPRVPSVVREDLLEEDRSAYDEIAGSRGEVGGPFPVLLNSPETARRIAHLGTYIRFESALPLWVRELAILITAREWDCQFEWTYHEPMARKAGVRDGSITTIRDRKAPEGLDPEEKRVARYCLEVLKEHRVSEATFQRALQHFGDKGITELTATLGYYSMLACVLNALEVEPEPGTELLLPL